MRIYLRRVMLIALFMNCALVWKWYNETANVLPKTNLDLKDRPTEKIVERKETKPPPPQFVERKSGDCIKELKRPLNVIDTEKWQKVAGEANSYVFSAFFDKESTPIIRVIALKDRRLSQNLFCQLWYDNTKKELLVTTAKFKSIPEGHSKRYEAVIYFCPLSGDDVPYAISLTASKCETPSNLMLVLNTKHNRITPTWEYSLCLTPFSLRYSRAYELVEMIELNRIFGVQQFFFYNYSTGVNVDRVLNDYVSQGIVRVIQWHLPMAVDRWPRSKNVEVHYFGQLASLNDCLYRNLYSSRYLVYTDLDEFIVPRTVDTFKQMLDKVNSDHLGAFLFRCVFYRKDWPQYKKDFEGRSDAQKYKSVTLLNVYKESKIWPAHQRSKYMVKPKGVEVVGIHSVWTYRPGFSSKVVDANLALLHHYRNWENPTDQFQKHEDLIIHEKYKKPLLVQLNSRWQRLPGVKLDIPITNYTFPL